MRAATAGPPGTVKIVDFPEPDLGEGEIVLAPLACGICTTDVKLVQKGSLETKYALGHELAGEIRVTAPGSGWEVGQRVVAAPYLPCGACYYCLVGQPTLCTRLFDASFFPGGLAERVHAPRDLVQRGLFLIPQGLSPEAASLAEPFGCAIQGLEACRLRPGNSLLVVGDGPMGLITAAIARAWGAGPVILAGMLEHRLETARRCYADEVIDIASEPLALSVQKFTADRGADIVIVAVSSSDALASGIDAVRPGGVVNAFAGVSNGVTIPLDIRKLHYQQFSLTGSFGVAPAHIARALHLLASGRVNIEPLITARFPFDAVGEAVAYAADRKGLKAVVVF